MSDARKQAESIRAQEMSRFYQILDEEMKGAYAQMADDLAMFHWGTEPGPAPKPLTRVERLGYRLGHWWYSARMGIVRGLARLLRVDLPRDDD